MSFFAAFDAKCAGISSPDREATSGHVGGEAGTIGEFHLTVTIALADYKANFCDGGHGGETTL